MQTPSQSIIVVGAGIFGVTAAIELRRWGYAVSLFDPGPLPHPHAASTDISKVIRMDYGADEIYGGRRSVVCGLFTEEFFG